MQITISAATELFSKLAEAAETLCDPKPILRDSQNQVCQDAALAIEKHYYQSKALRSLDLQIRGVSPEEVQEYLNLVDAYEPNGDLEEAYQIVLTKLQAKPIEYGAVLEFFETLVRNAEETADEVIRKLEKTTTCARLKEVLPEIKKAVIEDGKSIRDAVQASPAFDQASKRLIETYEATKKKRVQAEEYLNKKKEALEKSVEEIKSDPKLKTKLAVTAAGAAILGFILGRKS